MKTIKFLAAIAATLVIGSAANAASVTCTGITTEPGYDECYDVTGETGAFNLYGANAYDYNGDNLFEANDWVVVQDGDGVSQDSFVYPAGDWDVLALLIKAGNGIVALLYEETDTLSAWMSGGLSITQISNGVSGFTLLGREGVSEVPLPAAGWMLIAGLGGLFALRRRKTA